MATDKSFNLVVHVDASDEREGFHRAMQEIARQYPDIDPENIKLVSIEHVTGEGLPDGTITKKNYDA